MKKKCFLYLALLVSIFMFSGCFLFDNDDDFVKNYSKKSVYLNEKLINVYGIEYTVTNVSCVNIDDGYMVNITFDMYNGNSKKYPFISSDITLYNKSEDNSYSYSCSVNWTDSNTYIYPLFTKTLHIRFIVPISINDGNYYLYFSPYTSLGVMDTMTVSFPKDAVNSIWLRQR